MLISLYYSADCVDVLVVYQHIVRLIIRHCNDLIVIITGQTQSNNGIANSLTSWCAARCV